MNKTKEIPVTMHINDCGGDSNIETKPRRCYFSFKRSLKRLIGIVKSHYSLKECHIVDNITRAYYERHLEMFIEYLSRPLLVRLDVCNDKQTFLEHHYKAFRKRLYDRFSASFKKELLEIRKKSLTKV